MQAFCVSEIQRPSKMRVSDIKTIEKQDKINHTPYAYCVCDLYRFAAPFASSEQRDFSTKDVSISSYTQFVVCSRLQILALPRWRPCMGGYTKGISLCAFVSDIKTLSFPSGCVDRMMPRRVAAIQFATTSSSSPRKINRCVSVVHFVHHRWKLITASWRKKGQQLFECGHQGKTYSAI